jgi:hypothetical protein
MNKLILLAGILLMISSHVMNAQEKTGIDYFKGKWNLEFSGTPMGDIKMVIIIDQKDGGTTGSIQDSTGTDLYKVTGTEINGTTATVYFTGSQGSDVALVLTKKDDDHMDADIMNMFDSIGERAK